MTINQAAYVLEQAAAKNPAREVTAQDLKSLGEQFYSQGTEFNHEFSDLLQSPEQQVVQEANRIDSQGGPRDIVWDGAHEKADVNLYSEVADQTTLIDPALAY